MVGYSPWGHKELNWVSTQVITLCKRHHFPNKGPYIQSYGFSSAWVLSLSVVSNSFWPHGLQPTSLLCPWGFSKQEYWSGLPCLPPRDLSNPGIKLRSPALQADSLFIYRYESWTIKKAECQRTDAFELWDWRSLLRILWTARGSNLSIIKEINFEYSLEGLMLKLKLWNFALLM